MTATGDDLANPKIPIGYMALRSKFPDLSDWATILEQYSPHCLTFEIDIDCVIAGATEILGSAFPGGF
jgi:hypothetical protein